MGQHLSCEGCVLLQGWRVVSGKRKVGWASVPFVCPVPHGTCCEKPSRGHGREVRAAAVSGRDMQEEGDSRIQEVLEKGLETGGGRR